MTVPSPHFKAVLVVSLVLNVFLIGGVAGGLYQWHNQPKPELALPQHGLHQVLVQLPPAKRRELRQLMRQTRDDNQPLIIDSRQARLEVIRQLQAPTLDREALDNQLSKAREADLTLRARVDASLAKFASTLPAEERQTLADSLYGGVKAKPRAANKN
ncbi:MULTISPECIES: periplasmic heavy metal sensor [unclassified Pseudomonas]|uniref:periplasmic heavy metal sensor n=1 Tax=unclassified Pseudomonas TaxID=196821 RepID=UPI002AC9B287|nr:MULTISPECIES: periplasmic heavy metal sensor [unclassified Pseudomonas]MEB0045550.1 periplasmic heavy metal sensor [Pseudomonas sp. Dout3]MEB0095433.1 periplasmic heavy metal sensor [Pseudomonas sp. DC1.2]WPX61017.1 periplasmic heavy metal sensor [Pseudomonas sp. DC1.2]